ncbi:MAG: transposase [Gammaproteobacteria bacterium]|nr:transposase [Gammaproteobacteria bacterium]
MAQPALHRAHSAHSARRSPAAEGYRRRRPEDTALFRCVERHWPAFREQAEEQGGLPKFVVKEVEEYLRCGILEHGCLRLACCRCGFERLVGFSCKRRGFCPSCLGRRMTDSALHLVERVLPEVPLRQWVCSLPWRLRYLCGYDRKLCADVIGAFVNEVMRSLRRRAKRVFGLGSVAEAHTGAVCFVQRFDSALRLNVHGHVLSLDGVYLQMDDGALGFRALPAPTTAEVANVARRTALKVRKVLLRHGRSLEGLFEGASDASEDQPDDFAERQPALAACYGAALQGMGLFGERAGQPTLRLLRPELERAGEPVAEVMGFNVHAGLALDGHDRKRVERVCRYLGRPPIAQDRLRQLDNGRLRYTMKKPWKDGTVALDFEPLDLIARLCAMVPAPGFHMIRYYGLFSSHAKLRSEVVPDPPDDAPAPPPQQLHLFEDNDELRLVRKPWAWLVRHVFLEDVTVCPKCSGAMRWLEVATKPDDIARLLARQGLAPPPSPRPRAPPIGQLMLPFRPAG